MNATLPDGVTVETVARYLDRRMTDLEGVHQAIQRGDSEAILEVAHKIKGNAALYGLPELGEVAKRLMESVAGGDWATVARSATEMADRVDSDRRRLKPPSLEEA